MGILLPKYLKQNFDPNADPGPWYVVRSETYQFSQELAQDLKPMFMAKTLDECKWYIAGQMKADQVMGYELYRVYKDKYYLVILKYQPSGIITIGANQFIVYGAYSQRQATAGHFVSNKE